MGTLAPAGELLVHALPGREGGREGGKEGRDAGQGRDEGSGGGKRKRRSERQEKRKGGSASCPLRPQPAGRPSPPPGTGLALPSAPPSPPPSPRPALLPPDSASLPPRPSDPHERSNQLRARLPFLLLDHVLGLFLALAFFPSHHLPPFLAFLPHHQDPLPLSSLDASPFSLISLQTALARLLQHPGGFKLNLPLTHRLNALLLLLAHLLFLPSFLLAPSPALRPLLLLGLGALGGLSALLALAFDLCRLHTLPARSLFQVTARIYSLELSLLGAFWRLFRGQKKNILRGRIDSLWIASPSPPPPRPSPPPPRPGCDESGRARREGAVGGQEENWSKSGEGRGDGGEGERSTVVGRSRGRAGGRAGSSTPQLLLGTLLFTVLALLFLTVTGLFTVLLGLQARAVGLQVLLWALFVMWREGPWGGYGGMEGGTEGGEIGVMVQVLGGEGEEDKEGGKGGGEGGEESVVRVYGGCELPVEEGPSEEDGGREGGDGGGREAREAPQGPAL
ncbi:N-acetylglucosaminyl transferase component, partial [Nannochloropsis gaditana]